jgi:hypothetical protein
MLSRSLSAPATLILPLLLAGIAEFDRPAPTHLRSKILRSEDLRNLERDSIITALKRSNWKISGRGGAAQLLGINPNTLASRMRSRYPSNLKLSRIKARLIAETASWVDAPTACVSSSARGLEREGAIASAHWTSPAPGK